MLQGIISGGGIAGLTAAIAMKQLGMHADVFEAAPEILPVGAGIWMAPNAMQVFHRLGFANKVTEAGVPLEKIQVVDERMKVILDTRQQNIREKFGYTTTAIRRSSLQQILISELGEGQLITGRSFRSVGDNGNKVSVKFGDGASVQGDFLVGADGIHSAVREHCFGKVRFRKTGHVCWRGVAPIQLKQEFKKAIIEAWAHGIRFGFSEVNDGMVDWFAVMHAGNMNLPQGEALKSMLLHSFRKFSYPVCDILSATAHDKIITNEIMDFDSLARWDKGNICLIGDAAHASTPYMGQGGCQAVEDAYALALCLSRGKNISSSFGKLQQLRKQRAEFIVKNSRIMGKVGYLTGVACVLRNAAIRLTPIAITERQFCNVYTLGY